MHTKEILLSKQESLKQNLLQVSKQLQEIDFNEKLKARKAMVGKAFLVDSPLRTACYYVFDIDSDLNLLSISLLQSNNNNYFSVQYLNSFIPSDYKHKEISKEAFMRELEKANERIKQLMQ